MELFVPALMGIIQGLTEFLPVSSSGHLVLTEHIFGLHPKLYLAAVLHMGTLAVTIVYFRAELWQMVVDTFGAVWTVVSRRATWRQVWQDRSGLRLTGLVAVATIPTGIIGLGIQRSWEAMADSVVLVSALLLVTAAILVVTRFIPTGSGKPTLAKAFWLGVVQGLAVLPGISRSGSTIAAGLLLGMDREEAGRFSFLISVPAVAGAGLLEAGAIAKAPVGEVPGIVVGTLLAVVVGYLALWWLMRYVKRGRLHVFAWYLLPAGFGGLAWWLWGGA